MRTELHDALPMQANQFDLFGQCGKPIVEAALKGQTSAMFAYGQSGSGKTFSMLGADGGTNRNKLDGIIPQVTSQHSRVTGPLAVSLSLV